MAIVVPAFASDSAPHVRPDSRNSDAHIRTTELVEARHALLDPMAAVLVSPRGDRFLLRGATPNGYRLEVLSRESLTTVLALDVAGGISPRFAAWSPDGRYVAFLADSGGRHIFELNVWDLTTNALNRPAVTPTRALSALAWSPRANRLAYIAQPATHAGRSNKDVRQLYIVEVDNRSKAPKTLRVDLAPGARVAWAPDGRRVATVLANATDHIAVVDFRGNARRKEVLRGARIAGIAWSPDQTEMLVQIRRPKRPFDEIATLDLASGNVRILASSEGNAADPLYRPDGNGFLYTLLAGGDIAVLTCDRRGLNCQKLPPEHGQTWVDGFSPNGDTIFYSHLSTAEPATLYGAEVGHLPKTARIWAAPNWSKRTAVGERLEIRARDGLPLPAYVWHANSATTRPSAVLISIPGGPGLHQEFRWYPHTQYLLDAGIDVLTFNYRGQTGFGSSFYSQYYDSAGHAKPDGDSAEVQDVLAVRDYVINTLGVKPTAIAFFGHSHGALLAALAANAAHHPGPVILASMVSSEWTLPAVERCVVAFHGADDERISHQAARLEVARHFGAGATVEPCGHFEVLPKERHWYDRPQSWASVYASIATTLGRRAITKR
jgi:dipeptidyl aminopeptidase/acylaminoacyl peptidase